MNTLAEKKVESMKKDEQDQQDVQQDDVQLCAYVTPKVKNAFLAKAKESGSTGTALIRDFVHKYIGSEKTERPVSREVQEILPAFIDFMSSPPKEKHLRSLWDALWVILKNRAEKKK